MGKVKDILKKLRGKQGTISDLEIPPDHVRCSRCKKTVPKGKATVDLEASTRRTEVWVCDGCFFGHAI